MNIPVPRARTSLCQERRFHDLKALPAFGSRVHWPALLAGSCKQERGSFAQTMRRPAMRWTSWTRDCGFRRQRDHPRQRVARRSYHGALDRFNDILFVKRLFSVRELTGRSAVRPARYEAVAPPSRGSPHQSARWSRRHSDRTSQTGPRSRQSPRIGQLLAGIIRGASARFSLRCEFRVREWFGLTKDALPWTRSRVLRGKLDQADQPPPTIAARSR